MRKLLLLVLAWLSVNVSLAAPLVHHELDVKISAGLESIEISDTIHLSSALLKRGSEFQLSGLFHINKVDGATLTKRLKRPSSHQGSAPVSYKLAASQPVVTIHYSAPLDQQAAAAAGVVLAQSKNSGDNNGIFLEPGAYWYPLFDDEHVTFSMRITLPKAWQAISQGDLLSVEDNQHLKQLVWQEKQPQRGVFLIAGEYEMYARQGDGWQAQVFLRHPDQTLAEDYLDLTRQYLERYERLIGPYPYSKFALVESFWETGFGMPSFTFIGPTVIRLPFIRYTSYPHEVLHNWWGNSVYVDYPSGNWAEGLTTYLADFLLAEQRGGGANHRREALQKYSDFIRQDNDFSLIEFTSGHAAQRQAVGYGKTLMLFHMLRTKLGEEKFVQALQIFYQQYQFKVAAWSDLEKVFSQVAGHSLKDFFNQWTQRVGAPQFELDSVKRIHKNGRWQVQGELRQVQRGAPYQMSVPVAVTLAGEARARYLSVDVSSGETRFAFELDAKPLRLDVDPEFDLFRRLAAGERPPALSQAFGAEQMTAVLPSNTTDELKQGYAQLARAWEAHTVFDNEIDSLPADRAVWVLGWHNRFLPSLAQTFSAYGSTPDKRQATIDGLPYQAGEASVLMVGRNNDHPQHAVVWFASHAANALARYARRLPHYRKYGYLVFDAEQANIVKGQWSVLDSPMSVVFEDAGKRPPMFPARKNLADY